MVNKYINATYQEIYDLATAPNKVTILGIRTPSGSVPSTMLEGLWKQFKAVKYNGCDFVMRATARQPLDPLQIGTESGTQMDMRDIQNPILFRGCHGESLGDILNDIMNTGVGEHTFSGDSLDMDERALSDVENFYYQCLTDMSWQKSMPENGFARNGLHPLVYNVATNFQLGEVPASLNAPTVPIAGMDEPVTIENDPGFMKVTDRLPNSAGYGTDYFGADMGYIPRASDSATPKSYGGRQMFTNELVPLGWLDTELRNGGTPDNMHPVARIPRCYMGILMLPPAYTEGVRQFFRVVITHYFTFKDFRSISLDSDYTDTPGYYDTLNVSDGAKITLTSARVR